MKKLLFIIMCTLLITAACSNNSEKPAEKKDAAVENNATETSEVAKFPEYSIVKENIPSATYKESLESDTDDERVILFENENGKSFKSSYLKTRNILQIRDLEEDRLTYNKIFNPEK